MKTYGTRKAALVAAACGIALAVTPAMVSGGADEGTLTLVKVVHNGPLGTATIQDFTLIAKSQGVLEVLTFKGISGTKDVTKVVVPEGDYALSETQVQGYESKLGWDCGDAPLAGNVVSVIGGEDVTCTIINQDPSYVDQQPPITPTGADSGEIALIALGALAGGAGMLMISRRRNSLA